MNEKLRNGLVNAGLVVMSVVVFFVIAEGYFAVFNPQLSPQLNPNRDNEFTFYQYDETLGWKNMPNAEGMLKMPDSTTHIKINSKGLRDKSYGYKKPEGIMRIVVLGDSFTWGYGVEDKERYTEILEDGLLENIQVINMGVTGYGTDQEFHTLKNEGVKYNPDLVIIAFQIGTDISDNTHTVRYTYPKSMFVLDNNNKLTLTNVPVPQKEEWLKREEIENNDNVTLFLSFRGFMAHHSHAYVFIADRIVSTPKLLNLFKKIGIADKETRSRRAYGFDHYNWNLTRAILTEIDAVAKTNNAKTFIVIVPTREQVNKNFDSELTGALVDLGKENNITVLDCLPEFRKNAENGEELYFKNDGHWNANGHRLAAELIYDKLIEEQLIPLGGEH
jgi:lysophospholipase L1-like esterase